MLGQWYVRNVVSGCDLLFNQWSIIQTDDRTEFAPVKSKCKDKNKKGERFPRLISISEYVEPNGLGLHHRLIGMPFKEYVYIGSTVETKTPKSFAINILFNLKLRLDIVVCNCIEHWRACEHASSAYFKIVLSNPKEPVWYSFSDKSLCRAFIGPIPVRN